jgi:protein-S-isoprenylcysteine O-methyltransferase Ste14
MSSLVKVPFIIVGAFGAWCAFTPPQPPPGARERVKVDGMERSFGRVVRIHALVLKVRHILCFGTWAPQSLPEQRTHACVQYSALASLLSELVACLSAKSSSSPLAQSSLPITFVLGCLAMFTGGLIRRACYKALGPLFTFELSLREDHRLVTTGPYAFVRHPAYSSVLLALMGAFVVSFGPGSWWERAGWFGTVPGKVYAVCWFVIEVYVTLSTVMRAPMEDAFLKKQFGAKWDAWAARVPYKLVPGMF